MNNLKYVMLPRIEDKPKQIKQQPWYRERIREKYLTKNPNNKEKLLNAKEWVFIKDGLDDFRDGFPPTHENVIIKPEKGPSPMVKNEQWKHRQSAGPSASSRLSLNQRCFSKRLPMAQARKEKIEQIIENLTQHPLALYPHLEESLPSDLFEEILEILDPEINKLDDSESHRSSETQESNRDSEIHRRNRRDIREELNKLEESLKKVNSGSKLDFESKNVRNKYKWLLKKEEAKARAKGPEPEQIKAEAIDNHIKKVTVEFCDWVKSLGGEHNIDPVTLTSLFASGYDTKPPISVPIHVVELTNIPAELRPNAYIPPDVVNQDEDLERNIYRDENNTSRQNGYRYGAWYLPKEHWRLMPLNEKLVDPKIKHDEQDDESKKRAEEINSRLAPLHGAQAFKNFIKNKKPDRIPKLLQELDDWESEQSNRRKSKSLNLSLNASPTIEASQVASTTPNILQSTDDNNDEDI